MGSWRANGERNFEPGGRQIVARGGATTRVGVDRAADEAPSRGLRGRSKRATRDATCHGVGIAEDGRPEPLVNEKNNQSPDVRSGRQPATASCLGGASAETEGREPGDGKALLHNKPRPTCHPLTSFGVPVVIYSNPAFRRVAASRWANVLSPYGLKIPLR